MTRPASPMRRPPAFLLLLTFLALLLLLARPAAAQYAEGDAHFVGQPSHLTLPASADTLVVTYRPSTSIAREDRFPARGASFAWTPTQAGVVKLSTPGGEPQNVSVRFQKTPAAGLFVLIGAGLILFGGTFFAFRKLFEDDAAPAV